MITKIYKASTLSEAVDAIKKEMGPKANIVSTKKVAPKKGLFRTTPGGIEVTATIEERYLTQEQIDLINGVTKTPAKAERPADLGSKILGGVRVSISDQAEKRALKQTVSELENQCQKLKNEVAFLTEQLKSDLSDTSGQSDSSDWPDASIAKQLFKQGLGKELVSQWYQVESSLPQNATLEEKWDACLAFFLALVTPAPVPLPRLLAFVGPSGSGKTTTILKLAHALKSQGKRVAIFSLDTGTEAMDALHARAEKLGFPIHPVAHVRIFQDLLAKNVDCDHVLVDTYAVSPRDKVRLSSLQKRLEGMKIPSVAVFSAHDAEMTATLTGYGVDICAVAFTKLDETYSIARAFDFLAQARLPVAFYGTGRKIEEDIEAASAERLVALLFKLASGEGMPALVQQAAEEPAPASAAR